MTGEIVSDSTTVRVITFVTLLYMPATFIAVRYTPFLVLLFLIPCSDFILDRAWHKLIHLFHFGIRCGFSSLASILGIRRSSCPTHNHDYRMLVLLQSAYGENKAQRARRFEKQQAGEEFSKVVDNAEKNSTIQEKITSQGQDS